MGDNKESFLYTLEQIKTLEMEEKVIKITEQWETLETHAKELIEIINEKEKFDTNRSSNEYSILAGIVKLIPFAIEKHGTTYMAALIVDNTDRRLFRLLTHDIFKEFITDSKLEKQVTTLLKDIVMLKELLGLKMTPLKAGKIERFFYKVMRIWNQIEEAEKRQAREEILYQAYLKTL